MKRAHAVLYSLLLVTGIILTALCLVDDIFLGGLVLCLSLIIFVRSCKGPVREEDFPDECLMGDCAELPEGREEHDTP